MSVFGYIQTYSHGDGRIGVLVQINCDDEFTAKTEAFLALARDIALQIAAESPRCIEAVDIDHAWWRDELERIGPSLLKLTPAERLNRLAAARDSFEQATCLLRQPFIKDPTISIHDYIESVSKQLRSPLRVVRFVRFDAAKV